jgi:predicted dithiol-disulfide oxidoreductase (DUF899 family)
MQNAKVDKFNKPPVVSHSKWLEERKKLLDEEKQFTRLRDELSRRRRELPWERVEKDYTFEDMSGTKSLADLFEGRSQLIVYHAMFDPASASVETSWTAEAACDHCSFWADSFNGIIVHLNHRDTTMIAVSRANPAAIAAYQKRMGWGFKWVSSGGSDFNTDFGVSFSATDLAGNGAQYNYKETPHQSEMHGVSVFYSGPPGVIFHTYSCYSRGIDMLNTTYQYLDLVPKGRDEQNGNKHWVCRHDEYTTDVRRHGK